VRIAIALLFSTNITVNTVESLSYSPISLVDIGHLLINAFVIIAAVAERFGAVSTLVCVLSFGRSYIF